MTLAVAVKGPEGLVLAVDSRLTLTATPAGGQPVVSYFDNATKLTRIEGQPHVGVVTYGLGAIGTGQPQISGKGCASGVKGRGSRRGCR